MLTTRRSSLAGVLLVLLLVLSGGAVFAAERESGAGEVAGIATERPTATPVIPAGLDDMLQPLALSAEPGPEAADVSDAAQAPEITPGWRTLIERLRLLDSDQRARATIQLELQRTAGEAERSTAEAIETLWTAGETEEALEQLRSLEGAGVVVGLGIDWVGVNQARGTRAPDIRVGDPREGAQKMCLDFDAQNGNLFCVIRWGSTTATSAWTVNLSTDNGTTWTETYSFASSVGLIDVSAAVVDDYVYVAYIAGNATNEGRLRRCLVSTGGIDGAYGFQVIVDGGAVAVEEVALAANPDDFDNRIYYLAMLDDGAVQYFWDVASDGQTFSDGGSPPGPGASFSLDATYLHNLSCGDFLAISYASTEGSIYVQLKDESEWTGAAVEPLAGSFRRTSISAYGSMIICAYEYPFTGGTGIRYAASYDCGGTWVNGNMAVPDGIFYYGYFEPAVVARGGYGTAIAYHGEAGDWDPAYYQVRHGYTPGPWTMRVDFNEFDAYTGSEMELIVMPPLNLGIWSLGGMYLVVTRVPYFDRTIEFAVDAPVVSGGGSACRLLPVRPNPVSGDALIRFVLPEASAVKLAVYDVAGRRVATLADRTFARGSHAIPFDARRLGSGVYFTVLDVDGAKDVKSMVVRR
jgi:hypothetical protein